LKKHAYISAVVDPLNAKLRIDTRKARGMWLWD
jgi:hypothetical protein